MDIYINKCFLFSVMCDFFWVLAGGLYIRSYYFYFIYIISLLSLKSDHFVNRFVNSFSSLLIISNFGTSSIFLIPLRGLPGSSVVNVTCLPSINHGINKLNVGYVTNGDLARIVITSERADFFRCSVLTSC